MDKPDLPAPDVALQRVIDRYLHDGNRSAVGVGRVRELSHADPQRPHAVPRGAELDRCVKLAKQGDRLAAYRVHAVLFTDLRRGTLDARERELLASMHEAIVRGADPATAMLLAKPSSRPSKGSMHAFIADWIAREIDAHEAAKEAIYTQAGALFKISKAHAKRMYLDSLNPPG